MSFPHLQHPFAHGHHPLLGGSPSPFGRSPSVSHASISRTGSPFASGAGAPLLGLGDRSTSLAGLHSDSSHSLNGNGLPPLLAGAISQPIPSFATKSLPVSSSSSSLSLSHLAQPPTSLSSSPLHQTGDSAGSIKSAGSSQLAGIGTTRAAPPPPLGQLPPSPFAAQPTFDQYPHPVPPPPRISPSHMRYAPTQAPLAGRILAVRNVCPSLCVCMRGVEADPRLAAAPCSCPSLFSGRT